MITFYDFKTSLMQGQDVELQNAEDDAFGDEASSKSTVCKWFVRFKRIYIGSVKQLMPPRKRRI